LRSDLVHEVDDDLDFITARASVEVRPYVLDEGGRDLDLGHIGEILPSEQLRLQAGAYPEELAKWLASATTALAAPEELRASPQATRHDRKRIKELEREVRELRKTNEILKLASAYFAQAEFDRQLKK